MADKKETNSKTQEILLESLVKTAVNYVQGKVTAEELDELGKKLTIRSYMPILDKLRYMMTIVFRMNADDNENEEVKIVVREKELFFEVLLGGYAMVNVNNSELRTYETYDLLYPIFAPYILQYCEKDYNKLVEMLHESLNIYNLKDFVSALDGIDYQTLQKAAEESEKYAKMLMESEKLIADLKDLYGMSHPAVKELNDAISSSVNEELNKAKTEGIREMLKERALGEQE